MLRIITGSGDSRRLVVVSNRLPYNLPKQPGNRPPKRNVGGLVTALEPVLAACGGSWIGWDGNPLATNQAVSDILARPVVVRTHSDVQLHGVPLTERELGLYYHGFCNRALWPLFHDFPGKATFSPEDFASYERVNRRFAEMTLDRAGEDSRIWIHDFHLMLVPKFLRELGFEGRIDFFLHIPFPPPEIFRALPWRDEILQGVLAADGASFHLPLYRDNFVRCARHLARVDDVDPDAAGSLRLTTARGETSVRAIPIGIPVDEFERISRLPEVVARARHLRRAHRNCRIFLSADRLDYTKGIQERLRFVERYLLTHPEAAGRVVLIQIVVPSRHQVEEYRLMKREIDREVGRINAEHGREGWMPIHYRYTALDREDLVAHYLAADVALVTPLRDGMNLVASEFAAARTDEDGVLVVSEFAGIADRSPGAILVNPYDLERCATVLEAALQMEPAERRERMIRLRERVRSNPVSRWAQRCLNIDKRPNALGAVAAEPR